MKSTLIYRKCAYNACANQRFVVAIEWILLAIGNSGFLRDECSNLAYIAFNYCSRSFRALLYRRLVDLGLLDAEEVDALFLRLSFQLDLNGEKAGKLIHEQYVERLLRPSIKHRPDKPIVYWHIPKCSGTSLNSALGAHFYRRPMTEIFPGYSFKPLVEYIFSTKLEEIPFIPSMHFGIDELLPGSDVYAFTVLRDPVQRCLSMYRQEVASNIKKNYFRVFPRYGAFWDYRKDGSVELWLRNIPDWLLRRQLTTFSARADVEEARNRLGKLDYVFARDFELGSEMELFGRIGLDYSPDAIPKDLNRSDKRIEVSDHDIQALRSRLESEYIMLGGL